jgi:hypothetical protein
LKKSLCGLSGIRAASTLFLEYCVALISRLFRIISFIVKLREEQEFWFCDIIAGSPSTGRGANEQGAEQDIAGDSGFRHSAGPEPGARSA